MLTAAYLISSSTQPHLEKELLPLVCLVAVVEKESRLVGSDFHAQPTSRRYLVFDAAAFYQALLLVFTSLNDRDAGVGPKTATGFSGTMLDRRRSADKTASLNTSKTPIHCNKQPPASVNTSLELTITIIFRWCAQSNVVKAKFCT